MTTKKARSMAGLPWIAAMAFFMQALDATILNTALPAIAQSLNRSPLAMQSAIISYTLTVAMLIPVSGWLADRFGTRRVFMLAVTLFTLGSLACALSSSLTELVIFRVLQGIGGAMMMPVARLALLRAYPRSELLPVLNFVTMPGLVGPILGPVLGGVFVPWASWHWIFLINIPIGVAGLLYARKYMPNFTTPRRSFDMGGFFLFGLSLVLFSSGMELFGEKIVATWLALSVILGGILSDRWVQTNVRGRIYTSAIGLSLTIPALMLLGFGSSLIHVVGAALCFGIGFGMFDANNMPILCQFVPAQRRATAYGLMNMTGVFAGALVTDWLGKSTDAGSLGAGFAWLALIVVGALVMQLVWLKPKSIDYIPTDKATNPPLIRS